MKVVMFYSYKGGSGRTTATANIAASVAKSGKKVLCIDLDTGAPGLYVVFNTEIPKGGKVIQDYLTIDRATEQDLIELDLSKIDVLRSFRSAGMKVPNNDHSGLWLIPARQDDENLRAVPLRSDVPERRMYRIFDFYRDKMDFIFIDSPSGIQNMSALALGVSSFVLIFFTWSRQSLTGTSIFSHTLSRTKLRPFKLVASQVPSPSPEWNKAMTSEYHNRMDNMKKWFEEQLGANPVAYSIRENPILRIFERVIVFDNPEEQTDYDRIAKDLVSWSDAGSGRSGKSSK